MHYLKRQVGRYTLEEYGFESLHEIVTSGQRYSSRIQRERSRITNWLGASTYENFEAHMRDGWPALVEKMREMVEALPRIEPLMSKNVKRRRKRVRGDFGNEVDIHAVRQGRLDAWTKLEHRPKWMQQHKLVHLNINASLYASVTAQEALWRAAACYRIYEGLTAAGHSVAITMGRLVTGLFLDVAYSSNHAQLLYVPIKDYGQNVSDDKLAVMMCAGFYRYYLIEMAGFLCKRKLRSRSGSAFPLYNKELIPHHLQREKDEGALVITVDHCVGPREAAKLVRDVAALAEGRVAT